MKLSESPTTKQIKRLAHLIGFPETSEGVQDYINALAVLPGIEDQKRLMDDLVSTVEKCPPASQIRRMAWEKGEAIKSAHQPVFHEEIPRTHCPHCGGFGMAESISADDLNSIAYWCECEAGRERRRAASHDYVDRINAARVNLQRKFPSDPLEKLRAAKAGRTRSMKSVGDLLA